MHCSVSTPGVGVPHHTKNCRRAGRALSRWFAIHARISTVCHIPRAGRGRAVYIATSTTFSTDRPP
jgi:hypothetical protein